MPASISEAFRSPMNKNNTPNNTTPNQKAEEPPYNDMLSSFFPKINAHTPTKAPEEKPEQTVYGAIPATPTHYQEPVRHYAPPVLHMARHTAPVRHTETQDRHEDCHEKIANILACSYCREKLRALLIDNPLPQQMGGGWGGPQAGQFGQLGQLGQFGQLGQNTDLINMFLIVGMVLIIHKLFLSK
jgi:hypothetical protein